MMPSDRILVIDDDATLRRITARVLQTAGYEVLEAQSGAGGLELPWQVDKETRKQGKSKITLSPCHHVALSYWQRTMNPTSPRFRIIWSPRAIA